VKSYPMTIDGESVDAPRNAEVIDPATGEAFARVPIGDASHVELAVAAARKAFAAWSGLADSERQRHLQQLAQLLEANASALAELVSRESGKPLGGLGGVGANMEVGGSVLWTQAAAALEMPVEVIQDDDAARVEVRRKPLGVVASITPWNWPLMIAIWHVMPALRAGNTVVIKPSENTPVATLRFVQLAAEVLPRGVLNVLSGGGDVGAALTAHGDVNKIVFTGSTPTGQRIMAAAAPTLKRLTLELGGNDAGIVLDDVDPQAIAPKLFGVAFHNNGQTCACLKRLYVHDSVYDALCQALVRCARAVVVGDGMTEGTELGPLQNARQREIVHEMVEDARSSGARVLTGGAMRAGGGFFYEPTIVAEARAGMRLVDQEQFGPALPLIRYSDLDAVIAEANDNPCGLGGSIWSGDPARAAQLADRLECGTVWINDHGAVRPDAPFGGVKQSGIGVEFGHHGLAEYTTLQTVMVPKC